VTDDVSDDDGLERAPAPVPLSAGPSEQAEPPAREKDRPPGTPVWLLDVDGVLNAVTSEPDLAVWADYRSGYATARGRRWPITWSPTVVEAVRTAHRSGAAEVLWLTTWEEDANGDLADLLGLPRLPLAGRADRTTDEPARGWWKLQVARRVHEQDPSRPLLWTDDDLAFDTEAGTWISSRGLGISPRTSAGLDAADLDTIASFIADRSR
jgi:hypothetical protein